MSIWSPILILLTAAMFGDEIDERFPLGDQLGVLAEDVESDVYRKLVLEEMLITDLAAEWQRVDTLDDADSFLESHGGKEKVLADTDLKRAYERRLAIRNDFLDLMREGFRRHNAEAPFDKGEQAERAGTTPGAAGAPAGRLAVVLPSPDAQRHWPRFRGPLAQGHTDAKGLPTTWSQDENVAWRTAVPGRGNSSPVAWGEQVFLTSSGADGTERTVHCLNAADGRIVWSQTIPEATIEEQVREKNGFASATPVTDGERVIAFFNAGGLVCYDMDGNLQWHHPLVDFRTTHGGGSSPLLYENSVILVHDQNQADSICMALDKRTGELLWETSRPQAMGWSTPTVVRVGDRDELIYAGGETVRGYDPRSGEELWSLDGPTREVVPMIVVGDELVYSASGRNGPTIGFCPGGQGNVTSTHLGWVTVRGGPHVPSPAFFKGRLYTINDTGIATCLDAQTGEMVWQSRIRDKFSASPIEAEGVLYFPAESGVTYVIEAGDKFDLIAENDLGSPILASPAVVGNRLLIRTEAELVCVGAAE